jgi:autotransporter-associated beta strand protein
MARSTRFALSCLVVVTGLCALPARAQPVLTMYMAAAGDRIDQVSPPNPRSQFATLPFGANPKGVAFDRAGNLFVVGDVVYKVTPTGVVSNLATLPAGAGGYGMAIDTADNLYVADSSLGQISKITPGGAVSLFANIPGSNPTGLAFDTLGNLFVSSVGTVRKVSPDGGIVTTYATLPPGYVNNYGLAFDSAGYLYSADPTKATVLKIAPGGGSSTTFGTTTSGGIGLAFDNVGNLYLSEYPVNRIEMIAPNGDVSPFADQLDNPRFIAIMPAAVPEPPSWALLATGLSALIAAKRRRALSSRRAGAGGHEVLSRRTAFAAALALAFVSPASAQYTWHGGLGTSWNNGFNWSPGGIPNSATATALFDGQSLGSVTIDASVQLQSLSFANSTGAYTLTSAAGKTLSGVTEIDIGGGVTGIQTVNLANVSSGSLLFPGGNNLTIINNAAPTIFTLPTLAVGPNTVIGTFGGGGITVTGSGTTTINGSFASGATQVIGGVTKTGGGTLTLSGDNTNLAGGVSLSGGFLYLDYAASSATKLGSGALNLSGGYFKLFGYSGFPVVAYDTATLGTTLGSGHTVLAMQTYQNSSSSSSIGIDLKAITRQPAGTIDVVLSNVGLNRPTTSTAITNGILGGWATYGSDTWASKQAAGTQDGDIVPLASYATNTYAPGLNTDVTVGTGIPAGFTTNSLRLTGTISATLSGTNTVQSGGILTRANGANISDISGGTIASGTGELIVHTYSPLTIDSALSLPNGLTKTGNYPLILTGDCSGVTGPVTVNNGFLRFGSAQACQTLTSIRINSNQYGAGITFVLPDGQGATVPAAVSLVATYDPYIFNFALDSRVTLAGTISTAAGSGTLNFIPTNSPTSGFNLTGTNTFTNNVVVQGGVLGIASDASLGNAANQLTLTNQYSRPGLELLTDGASLAHSLQLASASNVIVGSALSGSINSAIAGVGSLTKLGTGTLTLNNAGNAYSGGTVASEGRLTLGAGTAIPSGTDVIVSAGAEFNTGGQSNAAATAINTLTLDGGTLRVPSGSGDYYVNQVQMNGGAVDFTGSTAFGLHILSAGITVNAGTGTWIGGGTSRILNDTAGPLPISVFAGGILNAGIILSNGGANPEFTLTGGGAVRLINTGNTANMTVALTVYSNDLSTNVGAGAFGTLGTGTIALTGTGVLIYDGVTAASAKPLTLTGGVGTIVVPNTGVNLTLNGIVDDAGAGGALQVLGTGFVGNPGRSTLTLLADNTYTGATYVTDRAILAIPTIADGGAASPIGASAAAFNLALGTASVFGRGDLLLTGTNAAYSTDRGAILLGLYSAGAGGAIGVQNAGTTLTVSGQLTGPGSFIKTGAGKLVLNNAASNYTGGTYVEAGVLAFATGTAVPPGGLTIIGGRFDASDDAQLGDADPTVNPAGTLRYTASASTTRTFHLAGGALEAPSGVTLTLNGAAVNGGFLRGAGVFAVTNGATLSGVTTVSSTALIVTGPGTFANHTNGGKLTVAAGPTNSATLDSFTNQGSGSIIVGATATVNASEFQTYGTLTINPATVMQDFSQTTLMTNAGTSPLYFNGGSRTFVGTPSTAVFPNNWPDQSLRGLPTFVAGIDLNGKNAVVAGGLFVNNGYVEDSTNTFQGTATIIADFGSLVKGAGYFQNTVQTINGGKFQAGNSPGKATFGTFVLGPGGVSNYVFAIDDANGEAGPIPDAAGHVSGWGLVKATSHLTGHGATPGDFTWTATPTEKLTVSLETLINPTTVGNDVTGMMDHFDPSRPYAWAAVEWTGSYAGPADAAALDASTAFDTSGFANPVAGFFGWQLDAGGRTLSLAYTPAAVPEPGSISLILTVVAPMWWLRFRSSYRRAFLHGEAC